MGILTEFFSRPTPREKRYRAAMATLHAMTHRELVDIGIKSADFPRIARQMADG